jgi:hypothetical protein
MRLNKSRLFTAAAVAGTVCALAAAGAAAAAPAATWSKGPTTIPGVYTNTTPALANFYQNNVAGTFLVWKGQLSNDVYYRYKINGKWSPARAIPGAHTNASPTAGFYTNEQSVPSEFVAWKALKSNTIYYATGEIQSAANSALNWTGAYTIVVKGDKDATSESGPSVLFPLNSPDTVVVSWRGLANHVRYELGTQAGAAKRHFNFQASEWITSNANGNKILTSGTPSLAETINPVTGHGAVFVFWKSLTGDAINYASTPDYVSTGLAGTKTIPWTLLGGVPFAISTASPAATDLSPHGNSSLLLAYKGPYGDAIRYQLLEFDSATSSYGWTGVQYVGGLDNTTVISPSALNNTVLSVSSTTSGRVYLHFYTS